MELHDAAAAVLHEFPATTFLSDPNGVQERLKRRQRDEEAAEVLALATAPPPADGLIVRAASDVQPRNVRWLWQGRIALGSITQVVGWPDQGKSTLGGELAARVSRGQLEGSLHGHPSNTLIATAEDDPDTTLVPRLIAAGADLSQVHFLSFRRDGFDGAIALPDDLVDVCQAIEKLSARLLIVDPLLAHIPEKIDTHKDQAARRALGPLAALAQEADVAILGLVHLNKSAGVNIFTRSGASIAFLAAARNALLVGPDPGASPDGPDKVLAHPKHNLSPRAPTLRYRLEGRELDQRDQEGESIKTSGITWTGEAEGVTDLEVLGGGSHDKTEREEAMEFLRQELADGPVEQKTIQQRARENAITPTTLRRAKKDLGVESRKQGMEKGWVWELCTAERSSDD